ncbi:MAG: hypothetical protein ACE5HA_10890 [Anaerolineae bacterium]
MFDRQNLELKLELVEAMAAELEEYLFEDDLYRQLMVKTPAGNRPQKMSAGLLLEMLRDLAFATEGGHLTTAQADRLRELTDFVAQTSRQYPSLYRQKLARELKSQIDSWRWFLQDCRDDPLHCQNDYRFEVHIRNRIALLIVELADDAPTEQSARIKQLDHDLQNIWAPGEFIFHSSLRDYYPPDRYWWLYGSPKRAT